MFDQLLQRLNNLFSIDDQVRDKRPDFNAVQNAHLGSKSHDRESDLATTDLITLVDIDIININIRG